MKAIVLTKYGAPDDLQYQEVERPLPQDDQVLIKVHAASVNPLDWHEMRGSPFLVRLQEGWRKPKSQRLGVDVAGRVEAVGKNVTQFQPGDEVFGRGVGTFAEYACAREKAIVQKPAALSFEAAAATPVASLIALDGLRNMGQLQSGQRVLVNGAAGGVGTFTVQMAKALGAEVTGVCSTRNLDLMRSIGAAHVIDYTKSDFTKEGQRYDLIMDMVGNHSVGAYQRALQPQGRCIIIGFTSLSRLMGHMLVGPRRSKPAGQFIRVMTSPKLTQQDLLTVQEWLVAGSVVPVIDRRYPLQAAAEAVRYVETGHARGKVVITVIEEH